jgi:hypothetical protein
MKASQAGYGELTNGNLVSIQLAEKLETAKSKFPI